MKILIVSDTHKQNSFYFPLVKFIHPDMVIHCGDAEGSEYALTEAADCPVHIVLGNNDFFSELPRELMLEVAGKKIWVTHGHNYHVSFDRDEIKSEGISRDADIVCFGHTHRPYLEKDGGILVVNPGSLAYPRQENHKPSYCVLEIEEGKEPVAKINYIEN